MALLLSLRMFSKIIDEEPADVPHTHRAAASLCLVITLNLTTIAGSRLWNHLVSLAVAGYWLEICNFARQKMSNNVSKKDIIHGSRGLHHMKYRYIGLIYFSVFEIE